MEEDIARRKRFSSLVSQLRNRMGVSERSFARRFDLSGTAIQGWEGQDGISAIDPGNLAIKHFVKLAAMQGWSLDELYHYLETSTLPEGIKVDIDFLISTLEGIDSSNLEEVAVNAVRVLGRRAAMEIEGQYVRLSPAERRKLAILINRSLEHADPNSLSDIPEDIVIALRNAYPDALYSVSILEKVAVVCRRVERWIEEEPQLGRGHYQNWGELARDIQNGDHVSALN